MLRYVFALSVLLGCYCSAANAQERSAPVDTADLYAQWRDRVLQVQVIEKQSQSKSGIGSGFLVGASGLVLTNYHVVADLANEPGNYQARFLAEDGTSGSLELLNVDVVHDLALLKSADPLPPPLEITATLPRQGTRLYSMGFPYDIGLTIVEGTYNGLLEKSLYERMHFTGSINPGMSGGPVLNQAGEVIGINVATAGNQVGFLVPAGFAINLLEATEPTAITAEELNRVISTQLQQNQAAMTQRLVSSGLQTTQLRNYRVPGELADWVSCWGDTLQGVSEALRQVYYQCQSQDDIFLSGSLFTGVIRFQHDLLSTDSLHPLRFYHQLEKRGHFPLLRLEGSEETVTRYRCQSGFVDQAGLNFKSTFCVRAYKKLDGIYDSYLYLTSLVDNQEALQSTLVLAGFSWENISLLAKMFVENMAWEETQP